MRARALVASAVVVAGCGGAAPRLRVQLHDHTSRMLVRPAEATITIDGAIAAHVSDRVATRVDVPRAPGRHVIVVALVYESVSPRTPYGYDWHYTFRLRRQIVTAASQLDVFVEQRFRAVRDDDLLYLRYSERK